MQNNRVVQNNRVGSSHLTLSGEGVKLGNYGEALAGGI